MNREQSETMHILVVDDEPALRDILQRTIKNAGYDCTAAKNAGEALAILSETTIDVVITDIVMPGMSGIELLEKINEKYDAHVMVITGFAEGIRFEEIIEKGACDFLLKPLSTKELVVRLKRVVHERIILGERNKAEKEIIQGVLKQKRIFEETVDALGSALEKRDPYTAGHQQRVTRLACTIAEEMGLPEPQLEGIRMAGLLHDIGKISTPTDILNKPSRLSKNEFNLIMEHPQTGFDILKDIEFQQPVARIVLQHHEKMNGSGYPQGLTADSILLEAKILTVADVVEAISSHRPYRPALGSQTALDEISKNKGTLYDSTVVETCQKLFSEKSYSFDN